MSGESQAKVWEAYTESLPLCDGRSLDELTARAWYITTEGHYVYEPDTCGEQLLPCPRLILPGPSLCGGQEGAALESVAVDRTPFFLAFALGPVLPPERRHLPLKAGFLLQLVQQCHQLTLRYAATSGDTAAQLCAHQDPRFLRGLLSQKLGGTHVVWSCKHPNIQIW